MRNCPARYCILLATSVYYIVLLIILLYYKINDSAAPDYWYRTCERVTLTFYSRWASTLPSCLWSLRIFPSLPGSRLTIIYRNASSALLQLVNQWLNFTYSRSHTFRYYYGRKKKHEFWFDKNRTHDFCTSRCAGYLLDVTVKCVLNNDTITQRASKHNCTSQCSPLHLQRISQPQARWNAISELNERDHDHDRSARAPRRKDNVASLYGNSRGEGDARRNHQAPSARATPSGSAAKGSKGVAHQPAAVQGKGNECGAECGGTESAAALMSKSREEQELEREAKAKEDREKLREIRKVI